MGPHKKIKVCHLISGDLWAGAEVQMFTLVNAMKSMEEVQLSAITLNEGKLAEKLRSADIDLAVINESENNFFQILGKTKKILKGKNIDILHTHRYKENILGAFLKKSGLTKNLVQTVHGVTESFSGIKMIKARIYSVMNNYYSRLYFDIIQPVSFDIENRIKKRYDRGRIVTIHNSVDPDGLHIKKPSEETRASLGLSEGDFVIGSVGRIVPVKGFDILLESARILCQRKAEIKLLVVGDGPQREELIKAASESGLQESVFFPGFREDILDIINCFDIYVISSYHEGIPMALLEAMALKKAAVATRVGGISEIIEENISGLLVNPGDAEALAESCLRIMENPELRQNLERESRARINREFSIEIQKKRVLELYGKLVDRK